MTCTPRFVESSMLNAGMAGTWESRRLKPGPAAMDAKATLNFSQVSGFKKAPVCNK